jgi:hypothetical protein
MMAVMVMMMMMMIVTTTNFSNAVRLRARAGSAGVTVLQIQGNMTAVGGGVWNISVSSSLRSASVLVTPPAPVTNAFLTIETIVNYNCQLFPAPPSTQVLFSAITVLDAAGFDVPLQWQPEIKHRECDQDVALYDGGGRVALMYNSSIHATPA